MKVKRKKLTSFIVGLILLFVLSACGGGADDSSAGADGGSDEAGGDDSARTVKVGGLYDITGATGDVGTPYSEGEEAYFKHLNNKGGIEGLNIELHGKDYAYEISNAQTEYQGLRDRDNVSAILGWGTGDTEALRQQVAQDELPFVSASYSENLKDLEESPYNFLVAASYSDQGRAILKWIKENHDGDDPKVALLYNDTPFGESPIKDIEDYAEEVGIEIAGSQVIDVSATDATSQILDMKKADPDYAIIQQTWGATSTILKDAKTHDVDTQFIGLNWASGEGVIELVGEDAEGYMGVLSHALPNEDFPGMEEVEEYLDDEGLTIEDIDQKFIQGWATAKIMVAAIEEAAEQTDGDITGVEIREALESIEVDLGGLGADVSFSADNHAGTEETRLGVVKDGEWEPITDYFSHHD